MARNKRNGRVEWNPYGGHDYDPNLGVNYAKNASRIFDPTGQDSNKKPKKEIKRSLLHRSSLMGAEGEYSGLHLDQMLHHATLIPIVGVDLQMLVLDDFAMLRNSDLLRLLIGTPLSRLREGVGADIFEKILAKDKADASFPERPDVIARLRLRIDLLKTMSRKAGYETLKELIERLAKRLTTIIPWKEPYSKDKFTIRGKEKLFREVPPEEIERNARKKSKSTEAVGSSSVEPSPVAQEGYGGWAWNQDQWYDQWQEPSWHGQDSSYGGANRPLGLGKTKEEWNTGWTEQVTGQAQPGQHKGGNAPPAKGKPKGKSKGKARGKSAVAPNLATAKGKVRGQKGKGRGANYAPPQQYYGSANDGAWQW